MPFPAALIENALVATAVLIIYFVIEPWLSSLGNFIELEQGETLSRGRLMLVAKKKTAISYKNCFEYLIAVVFAYQLLAVLVQPTLYGSNLFSDVFMSRVNTGQTTLNGAHVVSDLCIFSLFFLSWSFIHKRKGKMDAFQAALFAGFLVFVHESLWYVFYIATYHSYVALDLFDVVNGDAAIMLVTATIAFIYLRKYGLPRLVSVGILTYLGYLAAWFLVGFPITTVNNNVLGSAIYKQTIWYSVPWVNAVEVCSWLLLYAFFALAAQGSKTA